MYNTAKYLKVIPTMTFFPLLPQTGNWLNVALGKILSCSFQQIAAILPFHQCHQVDGCSMSTSTVIMEHFDEEERHCFHVSDWFLSHHPHLRSRGFKIRDPSGYNAFPTLGGLGLVLEMGWGARTPEGSLELLLLCIERSQLRWFRPLCNHNPSLMSHLMFLNTLNC